MSSICGIWSRSGKPVSGRMIAAMVNALGHRPSDRTGAWLDECGEAALGKVMLADTPESAEEIFPLSDPRYRLALTADARIDNREELIRRLDIRPEGRTAIPDSLLILEAYAKWGCSCPEHLLGDFVFALWDEREKRLFCARDHMGTKPFYYSFSEEYFLFASEMKGIFEIAGRPASLNPIWVADSLTALIADAVYTPYTGVSRLPPAHWMALTPREVKTARYWELDPRVEISLPSESDYAEGLRERIAEAVRCRVRSAFPIGSELSGGLDSSTVTAFASNETRERNSPFIAFSHVLGDGDQTFGGSIKDEKHFSEILRRHARIPQCRLLASQGRGVLTSLRNALQVQDGPTMYNFFNYSDVLYEAGEEAGIRTLLSGLGGDEMASFQAKEYYDELAAQGDWGTLWRELRRVSARKKLSPSRAILSRAAARYFPGTARLWNRMKSNPREALENAPAFQIETFSLSAEFYREAGIQERLRAIPRVLSGPDVKSAQHNRIRHPYLPLRMEYCAIAAAAHRIEYRYPLLDVRVLEFHLAVPSRLKRKDGYGRYLLRRAVDGVVPREIQWRDDKTGTTIPANWTRFVRDEGEIRSLIAASREGPAARFLDLDKMVTRLDRIIRGQSHPVPMRRQAFLNAIMLLLYFRGIPSDSG